MIKLQIVKAEGNKCQGARHLVELLTLPLDECSDIQFP